MQADRTAAQCENIHLLCFAYLHIFEVISSFIAALLLPRRIRFYMQFALAARTLKLTFRHGRCEVDPRESRPHL